MSITLTLSVLHWLAGLVVLAEALNKLERINLRQPGLGARQRTVMLAKALAWALLALGAGGALVTPLIGLERATLQDAAVLGGFALLIVRSRFKETLPAPTDAAAMTAAPPVLEPAALHIEPGQAVHCKAEGGCVVFNMPGLEVAIQETYEAGAREKCGRAI